MVNFVKSIIDVNITCYFNGNFDFNSILKVYPLSEVCNNSHMYVLHLDEDIVQYSEDINEILGNIQSYLDIYSKDLKDNNYIKIQNTDKIKQWSYISCNEEYIFEVSICTEIPEVKYWFDCLLD